MALTQKLQIRQSQALVMTPQLMQAIKLLQLSNLDLAAYVEGELEQNPLLERGGEETSAGAEADAPDEERPSRQEPVAGDWAGEELEVNRGAIEDRLDTSLDNVFPDEVAPVPARAQSESPAASSEWASVGASGRDDDDYNLEAFVSAEETLADHLAAQLVLAEADPARRMIGQYLIDMVDEAGYLGGDLETVAEKLGAPVAEVESVLAKLQGFDPSGICARNLAECLAIQLKERDRYDPAMQAMVEHLELLGKRDLSALKRICGVGEEDLTDMIAEIRALNPKPGLAFGSTVVQDRKSVV